MPRPRVSSLTASRVPLTQGRQLAQRLSRHVGPPLPRCCRPASTGPWFLDAAAMLSNTDWRSSAALPYSPLRSLQQSQRLQAGAGRQAGARGALASAVGTMCRPARSAIMDVGQASPSAFRATSPRSSAPFRQFLGKNGVGLCGDASLVPVGQRPAAGRVARRGGGTDTVPHRAGPDGDVVCGCTHGARGQDEEQQGDAGRGAGGRPRGNRHVGMAGGGWSSVRFCLPL